MSSSELEKNGSYSQVVTGLGNKSDLQESAEDRGSMSSSSWYEIYNENTGRYYWNAIANVSQYERPACLPPTTCDTYNQYKRKRGAEVTPSRPLPPPTSKLLTLSSCNLIKVPSDVLDTKFTPIIFPPTSNLHTPPSGNLIDVKSLYLSFLVPGGEAKWCYFNFGGRTEEEIVKESGLKPDLMIRLLENLTRECLPTYVRVKSSIYRSFTRGDRFSSTSWVQIIDIESRVGSVLPSLNEFMLGKARIKPCVVHMGDKVYVVGADWTSDLFSPHKINGIEVFTPGESNWETLPLISPELGDWFAHFVVAVEDCGMLVFGTRDMRLFLYDVGKRQLEKIDLKHLIPWCWRLPPVAVGNVLYLFFEGSIFGFDLVDRSYLSGTIDGLEPSFFEANMIGDDDPRLIYLGGGTLCLICPRYEGESISILHFCLFDVPKSRQRGSSRSLHSHVHSVHTVSIKNMECLSNVLLI